MVKNEDLDRTWNEMRGDRPGQGPGAHLSAATSTTGLLLCPDRPAGTPLQPLPEEPVFAHVRADSLPLPGSALGGRGRAGLSG